MAITKEKDPIALGEAKELCSKIDILTWQLNAAIKEACGKGVVVLGQAMTADSDLYPNEIFRINITALARPKDIEGE